MCVVVMLRCVIRVYSLQNILITQANQYYNVIFFIVTPNFYSDITACISLTSSYSVVDLIRSIHTNNQINIFPIFFSFSFFITLLLFILIITIFILSYHLTGWQESSCECDNAFDRSRHCGWRNALARTGWMPGYLWRQRSIESSGRISR